MLRKKPYLLLPALSLLLWCAAAWQHSRVHRFSAQEAAALIARHLKKSDAIIEKFLSDHPDVLLRAARHQLSPADADALTALPTAVFIYQNDSLAAWNTASTAPVAPSSVSGAPGLLRQDDAVYLARSLQPLAGDPVLKVVVLNPILTTYPYENDYLISHYVGAQRVPPGAEFSDTARPGAAPVLVTGNIRAGYISLSAEEAGHHKPDLRTTLLAILAAIVLLGAVQVGAIALWRQGHKALSVLLTIGAATGLRAALYAWGLPFELNEWPIFSPQLYASSALHPSLGDLLLNAITVLWIAVFLNARISWGNMAKSRKWGWAQASGLSLLMCLTGYGAARIIVTVALNSSIGFDVAHYYAFDADTISGLLTIAVLTGATALLIRILTLLMRAVAPSRLVRYSAIILAFVLIYCTGWPKHEPHLYYIFCIWLLAVVMLMDVQRLSLNTAFFSPALLFWMVMFCASATALLEHYVEQHELDTRKSFAERILTRRDDAMEWSFAGIAKRIAADTVLSGYPAKPATTTRAAFSERLNALYLNSELNNYNAGILLFDDSPQHHPIGNEDTVSYSTLQTREHSGQPATAQNLYYFEAAQDDHDYLAHIPLTDSATGAVTHLYIDLAHKKAASETVLPELLQPSLINKAQREADYQYAVYAGGRLVAQSPDYPFPYYVRDAGTFREYEWEYGPEFSVLHYRPASAREAIIVRARDTLKASITLFSYLFGLLLLVGMLLALYRYAITRLYRDDGHLQRAVSFTLRQRIQISMLGVVLASFLIIAVTTIAFFRQRYEEGNQRGIKASLQNAERAVSQHLTDNARAGCSISETAATFDFRKFIAGLARQQKADVNVYDVQGMLVATSQENIYNRGILNRLMRPQALSALSTGGQPLLIRREEIGKLSYISSYVPLYARGGAISGYINIPFFSSQKEIDAQVSNILVALINLYAFIFLLSSLLAVLTTRWLTRTLAVIIGQFNRLGLAGNELLEWPYEDEIGVLVREYNKMVRKVEESATLLAQSEREGAWREMARQVAHEIKNPLTPMKLNIQYLQSALRNDHPNLLELTKRVADSMLEQIDNLSYIASEFSNFAKLPEARPEEIMLNELLEKVAALYYNEPGIEVALSLPEAPVMVIADRSHLNRIITNLLQNAVQAIPTDERKGEIEISLRETPERRAVIAVRDNGTGIGPEVEERLFRPYFTTKTSGTGLGLAMTRKMVELWKGRIWYETEVGKGTTFFIELPVE